MTTHTSDRRPPNASRESRSLPQSCNCIPSRILSKPSQPSTGSPALRERNPMRGSGAHVVSRNSSAVNSGDQLSMPEGLSVSATSALSAGRWKGSWPTGRTSDSLLVQSMSESVRASRGTTCARRFCSPAGTEGLHPTASQVVPLEALRARRGMDRTAAPLLTSPDAAGIVQLDLRRALSDVGLYGTSCSGTMGLLSDVWVVMGLGRVALGRGHLG